MWVAVSLTGGYVNGMKLPIVQSQWNGFRIDSLHPDIVLDVRPTEAYPRGREAWHLSRTWLDIRGWNVPGVLLLGCDVAADPDDYQAMKSAVFRRPEVVHTGLVKLWPASTGRPEWMWSHRGGTINDPEAGQLDIIHPVYFSLGFVYIPRQLLDLAFPTNDNWKWGEMDVGLSEIAYFHSIPINVVYGAMPKHLHFRDAHNK